MTIVMIPYTKDYVPPQDGKYLVQTSSSFLKKPNMFAASVSLRWNEKLNKQECSIDVNNQVVTHISLFPVL